MIDPKLLLSDEVLTSDDEAKAAGQIAARAFADEREKLCQAFGIKTAADAGDDDAEDGGESFTENERRFLEELGSDE